MSRTIGTSTAGPVTLNPATDNPLTITSTGTVASTGVGKDGIDGAAPSTPWTVTSAGSVSSGSADGIRLNGGATLTNNAGGTISSAGTHGLGLGVGAALYITSGGAGNVTNHGAISGGGYGVALGGGGLVTNTSSITGGEDAVRISGAAGTISNSGTLAGTFDDGIGLFSGGSVTNSSGASISGSHNGAGIYITGAFGKVTNAGAISGGYHGLFITNGASISNATSGSISGTHNGIVFKNQGGTITNSGKISGTGSGGTGVYLEANSSANVTNTSSGTISASFGIFATAGGTVTNAGTISGSNYAIDFTASATNRLVVDPGAVFVGKVTANSGGTNTLELAGGSGSIGGLGGAGSSFGNFQTLAVDAGGSWALTGANTTTIVLDAGALDIAGTLTAARVAFQGTSQLLIDNVATFGSNVGTPNYTGPQLQDFVSGDKIDLKNISSSGVKLSYNASTGILQVSNGAGQVASLSFQTSSLGGGTFNATGDGANGTFITLGPSVTPPAIPVENDFNGDGKSDVLWRNTNGDVVDWTMNGSQITSSQFVTDQGTPITPDASWSVAGIGDFNGDGKSDVLWRNTNGDVVDWTMNGSQITSSRFVTDQATPVTRDASWSVAGIGDFNGDGKSDVLWRNTNGDIVDWTMNGSQITSSQFVTDQGTPVTPDASWSVAGIGDFNGDGKSDVLWRNTNGDVVDWTMNGSQIASSQFVTAQGTPVTPDPSWSVAGIGDFNGDGKSDVLWRNTNGDVVDWTMNGSQITSSQLVTFQGTPVAPNASWQVAEIGNFNGDGKSDILWRNSNGTLSDWIMNGSQVTSEQTVTDQGNVIAPNNSWSLQAKPTDFV